MILLDPDAIPDEELLRFASHVAYFVDHPNGNPAQAAAAIRVALRTLSSPSDPAGHLALLPLTL